MIDAKRQLHTGRGTMAQKDDKYVLGPMTIRYPGGDKPVEKTQDEIDWDKLYKALNKLDGF